MILLPTTGRSERAPLVGLSPCEHRAVSKDGRIVCSKIADGDNAVSPDACRSCPFKAVNCGHLRFSLRQTSPSPLIVRFNGRTEVWDDDPPEIRFEQAACAAKVKPIEDPRACAGCTLRQAVNRQASPAAECVSSGGSGQRVRRVSGGGRVVPFPARDAVAAAG
jgi:hypothetical protein